MILKTKKFVVLFFIVYLVVGLSIYKQFGISYDEPATRLNGLITALYITDFVKPNISEHIRKENHIPALKTYYERDYGASFDLITVAVEFAFHITDKQQIFFARHLLNFLLFFISAIFLFRTSKLIFKNDYWAFFSVLLYVLHPKFFAESFYNSKDVTFLSAVVIANYYCLSFVEFSNSRNAIYAALSIAFAITIRIMAIILPAIVIALFIMKGLVNRNLHLKALTYFILTTILCTYFFWPLLWENPFENFFMVFRNMSKFRWNSPVFYLNEHIRASKLPWHYLLVCFFVSTPFIFSLHFLFGFSKFITTFRLLRLPNFQTQSVVYSLGVFLLPLLVIILLKSRVYGGWRHVYFIYSGFMIVATFGAKEFYEFLSKSSKSWLKHIALGAYSLSFILLLNTIIRLHPYQNVYFNFVAGNKPPFEYDYWDLSYTNALHHLLSVDNRAKIPIYFHGSKIAIYMLSKSDRNRIIIMKNSSEADYYFSTYYVGNNERKPMPNCIPFYELYAGELKILNVFKILKQ